MVQCNCCHKQQLKDRFNEHCRTVDKQTNISKPTAVSEHFLSNDHTATGMQLIPLELVKSNCDGVRKAREAYLIERGQTLKPLGLNRRDKTKHLSFFFFHYLYLLQCGVARFSIFFLLVCYFPLTFLLFVISVYAVIVSCFNPCSLSNFKLKCVFALLVIICDTLKKKGCAFRNIEYLKNIVVSKPLISLAFLSNGLPKFTFFCFKTIVNFSQRTSYLGLVC